MARYSVRFNSELKAWCCKLYWILLIGPVREHDTPTIKEFAEEMERHFEVDQKVTASMNLRQVVNEARIGFRGVNKAYMNECLREMVTKRLDLVTALGDVLGGGFGSNFAAYTQCITILHDRLE